VRGSVAAAVGSAVIVSPTPRHQLRRELALRGRTLIPLHSTLIGQSGVTR
jgi:hypothetical protein